MAALRAARVTRGGWTPVSLRARQPGRARRRRRLSCCWSAGMSRIPAVAAPVRRAAAEGPALHRRRGAAGGGGGGRPGRRRPRADQPAPARRSTSCSTGTAAGGGSGLRGVHPAVRAVAALQRVLRAAVRAAPGRRRMCRPPARACCGRSRAGGSAGPADRSTAGSSPGCRSGSVRAEILVQVSGDGRLVVVDGAGRGDDGTGGALAGRERRRGRRADPLARDLIPGRDPGPDPMADRLAAVGSDGPSVPTVRVLA